MSEIILAKCQQEALDAFIDFIDSPDPWMVISGFAGSGKTFLVEYMAEIATNVLKIQSHLNKKYRAPTLQFTATTNKAASVLRDMLGEEVRTIHSLLGLRVINDYATGKQRLQPKDKVTRTANSIVFIDESSMINRELMHFLKDYQQNTKDCKLVFIGDPYQLPPVKEAPCNVFNATQRHYFLDEIQRQVAGNPIIQLSAQYRKVLDDPDEPWPEIPHDGKNIFFYDNQIEYEDAIISSMGGSHDSEQHKVLAWSNVTVRDYNKWIRSLHGYTAPFELNEIMMTNKPLMEGKAVFAPTDSLHRIINIDPDVQGSCKGYVLELQALKAGGRFSVFQPEDWKHVTSVQKLFAKDKNWQAYFHIKDYWADLRPIHALTCHKAQGSTYREVFVDLNDIGLNKNWQEVARLAYVAITRASEKLHVFGTITTNHQNTKKRNTLLDGFKNVEHLL